MTKFKVGDRVKHDLNYFWSEEWYDSRISGKHGLGWYITNRAGQTGSFSDEKNWSLVEEKKETEMTNFKVGDVVRWNTPDCVAKGQWQNFTITKVKEDMYVGTDEKSGGGAFAFNWDIQLVEPAKPEIVVGSKWTFTYKKEACEVLTIGHDGKIVLFGKTGSHSEPRTFVWENTEEAFLNNWKPYVEKRKLTGYLAVVQMPEGRADWIMEIYDTEDEARKEFAKDYEEHDYKLLDIVKVEWEEK